MATAADIDEAYRRGQLLAKILDSLHGQARDNPTHDRWLKLDIVTSRQTKAQTLAEIDTTFDALIALIQHLRIIDMAAVFELASQQRLGMRIGQARSTHTSSADKSRLPSYTARFLRSPQDYGSLKAVADLLKGHISEDVWRDFDLVRAARNNFAHGTDLRTAPVVDAQLARDRLKEILTYL